ncbi:HECT-domain-containing protein [Basidiobolus meristosporus CBS 931.73]|uniref:HECT-type E3 ubiquitin transferase n=1 Tax=Basidiobolus meristosporus CBS 931.73 TaxID=1314790 RepID=A0A1Y1Z187_9FUNG|nr:HECT-domain-containing protein [Basidiobolus meristosporus CBS 931.73]|eukprot:ORY03884.1 HECT-domain-containing protein [Basidiobolus meristosporus CBS 931.73]
MLLFEKIIAKVETLTEHSLIIFLMVLLNPLLMDPVEHHDIMPKLCDALLAQPLAFQKRLCSYISAKPTTDDSNVLILDPDQEVPHPVTCEFFQHYVSVFQQFITMRLLLRADESITPNKNEAVMKATKCLEILCVLNEEKQFVSFTEFYNDAVNEQIEIKEDFPRYKTKDGFSFCNYAFILNPATKSDILKVESMVQMRHELQDAFFRALFIGVNSPYLVLEIRRSHIIRDALFQLESKTTKDLKKQLRVQFVGEEGVDEGGVQKEFFQLVVSEMFDPKYGMFTFNEETRTCWFISNPLVDEAQLEEYRLIGRLIGLAIYNSVILDVRFSFNLYKKLMGQEVGLEDLKNLDPTLAHGLKQLLDFEGDVESAFERTFQIENEYLDGRFTYDLKPGGADVKLTSENRKEFVDLYVDFIFNKSVERQFNAFKEGFDNVCAGSAIQLFRPEEVEQLICGSSELDFEALERVTQYDGGFTKDSSIIKNFWEIVHNFTEGQKKKLLFFATGSDRVPIGGLSKLQFVIAKNGGDSDRLPTSHTCFNVLLLCEYSSKQKLEESLLTAIENSKGFGMI